MRVWEVPTFGQAVGGADGDFHVRGMQGSDNCCVLRTQRGKGLHVSCSHETCVPHGKCRSLDFTVSWKGTWELRGEPVLCCGPESDDSMTSTLPENGTHHGSTLHPIC